MKPKFLAALFIILGISAIGIISTASKIRQTPKEVPAKNRLQWHIQQAKASGRKAVTINAPNIEYLGGDDSEELDEAVSAYTVVIAKPIASRSYQQSGDNLITWTKFKIDESLTEIRPQRCFGCNSLDPPSDMLPLLSGEFLVPRRGGTLVQDGIQLTEVEKAFPLFTEGQKYLLLISLYPSGVALTAGGPLGVFTVDADEKITPINSEQHKFAESMKKKYQSSLRLLKKNVRKTL